MTQAALQLTAMMWRHYPRESAAFALLAAAGIAALAGAAWSTPSLPSLGADGSAVSAEVPPAPPPLLIRQLPPADALAINRGIPIADGPNPPAKPFSVAGLDTGTRARALECLASAVYYEAGSEDPDGQRAVAQVVLNRVRHPAFATTVCGVVYEGSTRPTGCQFTFTCDGSLALRPSTAGWARARQIAWAALNGYVFKPVGTATHYHADYVVPYWATSLAKNAVVGTHIFYRWSGGWGRPAAFTQRYARVEPDVHALRQAAVEAEAAEQQQETAAAVEEIPGAEELPLTPSMRGDKHVAIRFNLAARKAAEEAPRDTYVEKVGASDNLRWTLTGDAPTTEQKPLGPDAQATDSSGSAAGGSPE